MQRCTICFETDDVHSGSEHAKFEYMMTTRHEQEYPNELYFCEDCIDTLRKVTDYWQFGGSAETACAFCGSEFSDGTRISAEFVTQTEIGTTTSHPVYDLCPDCDEIFDTFLVGERVDHFDIPEGWGVFGPTSRHLIGFGTDHDRVYVGPAVEESGAGVQSVGLPEADANCYVILVGETPGAAGEHSSEIAAFEAADDAIEFARLVAMYAAQTPTSTDCVDSDFDSDPVAEQASDSIISGLSPRAAAKKMLGYKSYHLENALEKHTV